MADGEGGILARNTSMWGSRDGPRVAACGREDRDARLAGREEKYFSLNQQLHGPPGWTEDLTPLLVVKLFNLTKLIANYALDSLRRAHR
jgi:hypothetical protein